MENKTRQIRTYKRYSEAVYNNSIKTIKLPKAIGKMKRQTMVLKIAYRELNIDQHDSH